MKLHNLFLNLLFLGLSLQSFYFYEFSMPLISVGCFFLLACSYILTGNFDFKKLYIDRPGFYLIFLYSILFAWALFGLYYYGDIPSLKRIAAFVLVMGSTWLASNLYAAVSVESLLRNFLIVHAFFFLLQFGLYYGLGEVVDFIKPFTGESQRMFGGTFTFPIIDRFGRMAGLFIEPGTYATFLSPVIAVFGRYYRSSSLNRLVFWLGILTIFLSFSLFGTVFAALIVFSANYIRKDMRVMGIAACFAVIGPYTFYRLVTRVSLGQDAGILIRFNYLDKSFQYLTENIYQFLFGSNLLTASARTDLGMTDNDIGLLLYVFHSCGAPVLIAILLLVIYAAFKIDRPGRVALAIVLLSKHQIFALFLPFLLLLPFTNKGNNFSGLES